MQSAAGASARGPAATEPVAGHGLARVEPRRGRLS